MTDIAQCIIARIVGEEPPGSVPVFLESLYEHDKIDCLKVMRVFRGLMDDLGYQ
jgi:hypothetical protein